MSSSSFGGGSDYTNEYCLPATPNSQYTFKLTKNSDRLWFNGAWVYVYGIYGNIVFKNWMTVGRQQFFDLSLHYPVMKNEEWKMLVTTSIPADWNTLNFSDGSWTTVTLGSASAVSGTQYFRKTFVGLPNMAAYEVSMNYKFGIIAYVNGVEVYRDHMADGEVNPSTLSTDAFTAYEYHGFIRPAKEIEANSVLAVELHFPTTGSNNVEFDAFVASLASTLPTTESDKCFINPYDVTVTDSAGTNYNRVFDWETSSSHLFSTADLPITLTYDFTDRHTYVNAMRINPYSNVDSAPSSFTLSGAMSASGPYSTVLSASDVTYTSETYKTFFGYFYSDTFASYHLTIDSSTGSDALRLNEIQPMTCADVVPPIVFTPASSSVFAKFESVLIRPTLALFSACSITPTLPAGIALDAATCVVSGIPTEVLSSTEFTVTSVVNGQTTRGTFTLEVVQCTGMSLILTRTYKWNPQDEVLSITDSSTGDVVFNKQTTRDDKNTVFSTTICLMAEKVNINMNQRNSYTFAWEKNSFLYLRAILYGEEYDTVLRMRYDREMGYRSLTGFRTKWSIAPQSQWFYKVGQVPAEWTNESTAGWESSVMGSYPASSTPVQLYKNSFSATSLEDVAGFVISLRYQYGCVIYMNGVEVFRNGVEGELSADSVSTNTYTELKYHQISLPKRTMTTAVNYLQEGTNTIAAALVAPTASQTAASFDCTVRLVNAMPRVFDYSQTPEGLEGDYDKVLDTYYETKMSSSTCADNSLTVVFDNDRREWLSSFTLTLWRIYYARPALVTVKARNNDAEAWVTLRDVSGMVWFTSGEKEVKRLWLESDRPYNQYRFENIATGNPNSCAWTVSGIGLFMDLLPASVADFAYPSSSITAYKDVGMTPQSPSNNEYYYDFTISPALSAGLTISSNSGVLQGTALVESPTTVYQVTAKKVGGGTCTVSVSITVLACTGDRSRVTAVIGPFYENWRVSYSLYLGKTASGSSIDRIYFVPQADVNEFSWCLPHSLYTLAIYNSMTSSNPSYKGWYLAVDDEMVFEVGQVRSDAYATSVTFSSLLPFQVECGEWKVWNKEEAVSVDWKSVDCDEAGWETKKAVAFGNHTTTTAYVRHEVNIPSLDDYHVLNVRVKYAGGVVAYFNGRIVARFNLEDNYDENTEAIAAHDATLFSKFHVVLPTVGAVTGKNVIAFEIHRAAGESALVFDATGVFGVNECSPVLDSFSAIDSSDVSGCTKEDLLDLNPLTLGNIPNTVDSFLSWTVENLEGSRFNSFALQTQNAVSGYDFSIHARWESSEEYTSALAVTNQTTTSKGRSAWSMPLGHAVFNQFKFVVDAASSDVLTTSAYVMQYCVPQSTGACAADGNYPAVNNGEKSVLKCPQFMLGYTYRECVDGVLGEVLGECTYKPITNFLYSESAFTVFSGSAFSSGAPTFSGLVALFEVSAGSLPTGLSLNATTGVISGTPKWNSKVKDFSVTIRASNPEWSATVVVPFHLVLAEVVYMTIGLGIHAYVDEEVTLTPYIVCYSQDECFTRYEVTGLPEGLNFNTTNAVISGAAAGPKHMAELEVRGYIEDGHFSSITVNLLVHDHSTAGPLVPPGASCSHSLRLRARRAVQAGTVYVDSAYSVESQGLTGLAMEAGEVKSVYVCLSDKEYYIHTRDFDVIVMNGVSPRKAIMGDTVSDWFNPFSGGCEETLDTECVVIMGDYITVREIGEKNKTVSSSGPWVRSLNRGKSHEMCVCV